MIEVDFDRMIVALLDERDPVLLEEIVCHFANLHDVEVLEIMRRREKELIVSFVQMRDGIFDTGRWFDIEAAIRLCHKQVALIDATLAFVRQK